MDVIAGRAVEIGPVLPGETDSFLALMCDAFGMEFAAAKPVFDSDPYFDCENKRVLRIGGAIAACLTIVDRTCWIGDARVRVAGIAGVATRPELRRRGIAAMLLTETIGTLAKRGFHLSALFPVVRDYYRRFGWETAGEGYRSHAFAADTEADTANTIVRRASEADIPALSALYDVYAAGRAMHCVRDHMMWQYLLTYVPHVYVAVDGTAARNAEGYIMFDFQGKAAPSAGERAAVRVLEMVCAAPRAGSALRNRLRAVRGDGDIDITAPPSVLAANGFAVPSAPEAAFMARIADWLALLSALAANWRDFRGTIALSLSDSVLADAPHVAVLTGGADGATVTAVDPQSIVTGNIPIVAGDIHGWSAVAVGHVGGREACDAGLLRASSPAAAEMASALFPRRAPFIPAADHF
ncbi:MAG TPA: GNAT family N-acetyltransferase [Chthonomonadaceae bacterium]|nr:GNAT family N-acetyltransferase [Chthonomonadaceae bacterium]